MCADPVTATAAAAGLFKGGADILGGYQQAAESRYQAKIYDANAHAAYLQGAVDETQNRKESALAIASGTNALASRGVIIDSGTPLLLLSESARNAELDALQIRTDAYNKALNFKLQSAQASHEANAAITGGWMSAAGELLGSGFKLAELGKLPFGSASGAGAAAGAASGSMSSAASAFGMAI